MTSLHDALTLIVIPARFGSKRLPGKPLIPIAGYTLLERVVGVARRALPDCGNATIVVATDDARVERHARALGCDVAMTSTSIASGSGRAYAAASAWAIRPDIIVNLQGDAPFVPPAMLASLVQTARATDADVVTPVVQLDWGALDAMRAHKVHSPFSGTTCIRAPMGNAIWFSKSIIPAIRDEAQCRAQDPLSPIYRHLGLYVYNFTALERFERSSPSHYELLEGLEQLRFLELDIAVRTVAVTPPSHAMSGIDTQDDVRLAEELIERLGDPHQPW